MSVFLNKADQLALRLNRVAGLEAYQFIVSRPRKLAADLERQLAKSTGAGVIVWQGGASERAARIPRIASRYTVSLVENPTLRRGEAEQDEIAQRVIAATHHWSPDEDTSPNAFRTRFELLSVAPAADAPGIELTFESVTQFPDAAVLLTPISTTP